LEKDQTKQISQPSPNEALNYASTLAIKVVLLDGLALTNLMIDHSVGVTTQSVYEVKRIDSDYFDLP
jgi:restriction system protein